MQRRLLLAVLLVLLWSCPSLSGELAGRVVSVHDGDTLTVLVNGRERHTVRLSGIDAPEAAQAYGQRAKRRLSELAYNRVVQVVWTKRDRYGRIIGKILVEGTDVSLELVKSGLAWHYKRYEREQVPEDRSAYALAEGRARSARIGIWERDDSVAPWNYRKGAR